MRIFICAKCFNPGGTLVNMGGHKNPHYQHQGACPELNYGNRNRVMSQAYPALFWLPLLNIGVDFDKSILNP